MTTLYEAMMIQGRQVQACQIFPGTYKDWKCSVSARCDLFPFYQIFKFHITNTGGKNSIKATDLCNTPDENLGVYIYMYISEVAILFLISVGCWTLPYPSQVFATILNAILFSASIQGLGSYLWLKDLFPLENCLSF